MACGLGGLAFVGSALEKRDSDECADSESSGEQICSSERQMGDEERETAENCTEAIENEHRTAVAEPEVREAMRGVVLARRSERKQSAAAARDGNESGIEDRDAEDQDRHEPSEREAHTFGADLQAESGHQKTEEHRAAIAHEDFGRIEIPAQEAQRGAKHGRAEGANEHLPVEAGRQSEEARRDGRNAGAETVHVIENAEGRGDADDPEDREAAVEHRTCRAGNELREKLSADSGRQQKQRGDGHADEKLHLMVKQASVVEESDGGDQRRASENGRNLVLRHVAERKEDRENESEIDGDAAQQRNRLEMNLARPRMVHHAVTQGEMTNGHRE